jgi:hypothetical protein
MILLVAVLALPLPAPANGGAKPVRPAIIGSWGGEHIGLVATDRGARIDFDCANGSIEEPITPDDQGRFDVAGTYVRERPGPVRPNDSKGERARYRGRIEGKTMTLSVELAGSDVIIGTYTLERDRLPRIRKCG